MHSAATVSQTFFSSDQICISSMRFNFTAVRKGHFLISIYWKTKGKSINLSIYSNIKTGE